MRKVIARPDYCKLWTGKKNSDGYGVVRSGKEAYLLHRVVWSGINGPIPRNKIIMHKCDTPACFNPNHLILGTRDLNNKDRMMKNRSAVGERAGRAKLTTNDIRKIRYLYKTGNYTTTQLGVHFGVSNHQISMITRRMSWRHI